MIFVKTFFIGLSLLFSSVRAASKRPQNNYCAAIRGNGELITAHWGALARMVETYGTPQALAGGSSASLSMFLMDSMVMNPLIKNNTIKKTSYLSLLLKSLEGHLEYWAALPDAQAIMAISGDQELKQALQKWMITFGSDKPAKITPQNMAAIKVELLHYTARYHKELAAIAESSRFKGLINPELIAYAAGTQKMADALMLNSNLAESQRLQKQINFRFSEIKNAIQFFGKFNAKEDGHLFIRHGLGSFKGLAAQVGQMANYYAGRAYDQEDKNNLATFLTTCAPKAKGLTWQELNQKDPSCRMLFIKGLQVYNQKINNKTFKSRLNDNIGEGLKVLPTTAVLSGDAVSRYEQLKKAYDQAISSNDLPELVFSYDQLHFGYWGQNKDLKKIKNELRSSEGLLDGHGNAVDLSADKKSLKFFPLGNTQWENVLLTSPAEPGLSRLTPIAGHPELLSAGGWSDLHPVPVLKALGCSQVVYVTRRDGESLFAQGAFKKLVNLEGAFWDDLNAQTNNAGKPDDQDSDWSLFYNLGNPKSSLNVSLQMADAVLCTDWNNFDVTKGIGPLILDGYQAPFYVADERNVFMNRAEKQITRGDNEFSTDLGFPLYRGCLPY